MVGLMAILNHAIYLLSICLLFFSSLLIIKITVIILLLTPKQREIFQHVASAYNVHHKEFTFQKEAPSWCEALCSDTGGFLQFPLLELIVSLFIALLHGVDLSAFTMHKSRERGEKKTRKRWTDH